MSVHLEHEHTAGRPRNPKLDRAILDAVIELLGEEGYERMSIESVAQRAGVGKPTIYRRWPSKQAMVIEALTHLGDAVVAPSEGTVRQRLTSLVERLWSSAARAHTDRTTLLSNLIGEIHRSTELRDAVRTTFITDRRRRVVELLEEGVAAGEIAANTDLEVAADLILSPLMARKILSGGTISPAIGRKIVDTLFAGIGVGAPRHPRTG